MGENMNKDLETKIEENKQHEINTMVDEISNMVRNVSIDIVRRSYNIGQASIIAMILSEYSEEEDFIKLQRHLRDIIKQNDDLREQVSKFIG